MRRIFLALAALCVVGPRPAAAQTVVAVDTPVANSTVQQPFLIGGWAIDLSSTSGPGVNVLHIWAQPHDGRPAFLLAAPLTTPARPDVGAYFGQQFTDSAYNVWVRDLLPGVYTIALHPFSTVVGNFGPPVVFDLTIQAQPYMWVDIPQSNSEVVQPFYMGGWAIEKAASTGTGVNTIHFWAWPWTGAPPVFLGAATQFGSRPDVGAYFGAQFTPSGFMFPVSGLAPGTYTIVAYAFSLVAMNFNNTFSVAVTVDRTLQAPVIQPGGNVYGAPMNISMSAETDVEIRYTLDGSIPTAASALYTAPFVLSTSATVTARAFRTGTIPSAVAQQTYVLLVSNPDVQPASGTYPNVMTIAVTPSTPGTTTYWTDTGAEPTTASNVYSGPITYIGARTFTFKAKSFRAGWTPSATVTRSYVINTVPVVTPSASPGAGTYDVGQQVSLIVADAQAQIRYTLDGTTPTEASTLFTSALTLTQPTTITARAFRPHYPPSAVFQAVYMLRVPTPQFFPPGGTFTDLPLEVGMSVSATGTTIRYTVDGDIPTTASAIYSLPVPLTSSDTTITAIAFRSGWAPSRTAAHTYVHQNLVNPPASPAPISVSSNVPGDVQPTGAGLLFSISGGAFAPQLATVTINGAPVESANIFQAPNFVSVPFGIADGMNDITFSALDSSGATIEREMTVWGGSRSFTVNVIDPWNFALGGMAVSVHAVGELLTLSGVTSPNGSLTFFNVPAVPLRIQVEGTGYMTATGNANEFTSSITLRADVDDNEFTYDGYGWDASAAVNHVVADIHYEGTYPWAPCPTCPVRPQNPSAVARPSTGLSQRIIGADTDAYIHTTAAVTPQTITRVFNASEGSTEVSIRYRFISLEFVEPAVRANDSYTVTLRNVRSGQVMTDSRGVFALAGVATPNGETPWRSLTVPALPGDQISITATVANAVDNAHVSILQLDRVAQQRVFVRAVTLNDMHHRPNQIQEMRYISATPHTAYGGYTRIHGTITIQGPVGDALSELRLEFKPRTNPNVVIATAELAPEAAALVLRPFDGSGRIAVTASQLLFRIPPAQLAQLAASTERRFAVWVTGRTQNNRTVEPRRTAIDLRPLVYYQGANVEQPDNDIGDCIYPPGWVNNLGPAFAPPHPCGGGAWTRSHVPGWAAFVDATLGDFSNMNGLRFPIHGGHQSGLNTDGGFPGVTNRASAATAQRLIDILRLNYVGIQRILITHTRNAAAPNAFYRTLLNAPNLPDGRRVQDVIIDWSGHADHFHINWRDRP